MLRKNPHQTVPSPLELPPPPVPGRALLLMLALSIAGLLPRAAAYAQAPAERADALADSGDAHLALGDADGARRLFEQALALQKDHLRATIGLGRAWLALPAGTERALEALRRGVVLDPLSVKAHYYKGLAHLAFSRTDVGRDNAVAARRELETVLELDPSHSDALFRLGELYRDVYEDGQSAAAMFRRQVEAFPGHMEARLELLKAEMDIGEWRRAVTVGEEILARDAGDSGAYPYLSAAYWKAGRPQEAMDLFERYFVLLQQEEQYLYFDMGLVLTPGEAKEFEGLDAEGRRAYWAQYWRSRDPDLRTDVNERLLEHYIRVAYARIMFGKAVWPWDPRGDFYVRYGEPDIRTGRGRPFANDLIDDDPVFLNRKRDFEEGMGLSRLSIPEFTDVASRRPTGLNSAVIEEGDSSGAAGAVGRDPERWVYMDRGIDITFIDEIGRGRYFIDDPRQRQLVEQMEVRRPTISEEEERIELIDPMDSVVTFMGTAGNTRLEYAFGLLPDEFGAFRSVSGSYATIDVAVTLYTPDWKPVTGSEEASRRLRTIPQVTIRGTPLFVDATRFEAPPGDYLLTALLMDPVSGKRARTSEELTLPDYAPDRLMLSDILPAAHVGPAPEGATGPFIRGDLQVLPLPGRTMQADQPLFIYYEIYHLKKDPVGATDWEVRYSVGEAAEERNLANRLYQGLRSLVGQGERRSLISNTQQASGIRETEHTWLEVDVSNLPPGTYELRLDVIDHVRGSAATNRILFRTLPPPVIGRTMNRNPFLWMLLLTLLFPAVPRAQEPTVPALIDSAKVLLDRGGDPDAPVLLLKKAVTLAPQDPAAHYWLGRAYEEAARGALGRQNEADAKAQYEAVVTLDPSHPDAYYRIGLLLKNVWEDTAGALKMFRLQQEASPSHSTARFEQLRCLMDLGSFREAIAVGEEALKRNPEEPGPYPWLAGAYWKTGDPARAMQVFDRYFEVVDKRERDLYFDMGLVLTPEEKEEFVVLEDAGKRAWWEQYWKVRDPNPRTEVNERLLEHYIRIAYARLEFGKDQWPFDDRGAVYVRYGEPDHRSGRGMPVAWGLVDDDGAWLAKKTEWQRKMGLSSEYTRRSVFDNPAWDPPLGLPKATMVAVADSVLYEMQHDPAQEPPGDILQAAWDSAAAIVQEQEMRGSASASPERWVYEERGIDLRFVDFAHSGKYVVNDIRSRLLVQQMEERAPTISEEEERIERIDPMDSVTTFRGEGGSTQVTYAYALLPDEFGAFRSVTGAVATLDVEIDLYAPDWTPVDAATMEVPAGSYLLATLLMDPVSGRRAVVQEDLTLPDYSGTALMMSDVLPAARVQEKDAASNPAFVRGDLEVTPLPGRVLQSDQPLYIYYELYNLERDPIGATEYAVEYSVGEAAEEQALATRLYQGLKSLVGRGQKRAVLSNTQTAAGISPEVHNWLEIDMSALPPGTYDLTLTVTDAVSGAQVEGRLLFRTLPPVPKR